MNQFHTIQKLSRELSRKFPQAELFLVGGGVRDLMMGRPMGDIDMVARNVPLNQLVKFLKTRGDAGLAGRNFGVIQFRPKNHDVSFDIALPRTDHAFNTGGYRDVTAAYDHRLPIEKDLERRDFTCNAIALRVSPMSHIHSLKSHIQTVTRRSPLTKHLNVIDPLNGLADIKKGIIRAVGDPEERFREDYTRILRALRFACQLNFQIEKETWNSLRKNAKKINARRRQGGGRPRVVSSESGDFIVARELVAKEFLKGMYHDPMKMLTLMDESGLLRELIPELLPLKTCIQDPKWHSEGNVWQHTILALQAAHSFHHSRGQGERGPQRKKIPLCGLWDSVFTGDMTPQEVLELYLSILFHDSGKPRTFGHEKKKDPKAITYYGHETVGAEIARRVCARLKLSAPEEYRINPDHVVWCVKNHMLLHPENSVRMKNSTLEKYFYNPLVPGNILIGVSFFDGLASVPLSRRRRQPPSLSSSRTIGETGLPLDSLNSPFRWNNRTFKSWPSLRGWWKTVERLKRLSRGRRKLPDPLLKGNDIMEILKIKPGPLVGKVIQELREKQLSGKIKTAEQAKRYLKNYNITLHNRVLSR